MRKVQRLWFEKDVERI